MEKVDRIHEKLKSREWYKNLSLDQKGETCVKIAKYNNAIITTLRLWCENQRSKI